MILGIENVSLAHIVKNPWLDKDLRQGMTNLTVRIVLENFSQSVALPAPNQLQALVAPDSSPSRVAIGIMIVLFVHLAADLWWAKDLSLMLMTSFVLNVPRKNLWQIQLNNKS
jgi:hypothetical protein